MAIIAEFADDIGCATPLFTLTSRLHRGKAMGLVTRTQRRCSKC